MGLEGWSRHLRDSKGRATGSAAFDCISGNEKRGEPSENTVVEQIGSLVEDGACAEGEMEGGHLLLCGCYGALCREGNCGLERIGCWQGWVCGGRACLKSFDFLQEQVANGVVLQKRGEDGTQMFLKGGLG